MTAYHIQTFASLTAQQIADKVVAGLAGQGWKRSVYGTHCRYRNPDGCKCPAGHLIEDSEYRKEFERNTWVLLVQSGNAPKVHLKLITKLQYAHDGANADNLRARVRNVIENHGLTFNEP